MKLRCRHLATTGLAAAAALFGIEPHSQAAANPEPAKVLDDVVVTAQRREENIQDVPISMLVANAAQLEQAGVDDLQELPRLVPNLSVARGSTTANLRVNIRGIGAATNSSLDPSVATFLDGVYLPRPASLFGTFLDIDTVEVSRGPQGTLFGRNATAGAMNLRTADPTPEFSSRSTLDAGSFGRLKAGSVLNTPLGGGDAIALRIAAQHDHLDGYARNRLDGKRYGKRFDAAYRMALRIDFSAALNWMLKLDHAQIGGDGLTELELLPGTVSATAANNLRIRLGGVVPDLADAFDHRSNQIIFGDLADRQNGASSKFALATAGGYSLNLLSGWRDWHQRMLEGDISFAPRNFGDREPVFDSANRSHELQLVSPLDRLFGGRFDFVAGLYDFHERYEIFDPISLGSDYCSVLIRFLATAGAVPAQLPAACAMQPQRDAAVGEFAQIADSRAIYGQARIALSDALRLTLGGRYTRDEKFAEYATIVRNVAAGTGIIRAPEPYQQFHLDESQSTWRASLSWNLDAERMLFLGFSSGYKPGGFNNAPNIAPLNGIDPLTGLPRRQFKPETADNFEVGAKTRWLDDRLRVNATLFSMDLEDFQDRGFDGASFFIRNAGSLRHQGLELESEWRASANLQLVANLAYLDSEFTDYRGAPGLPGCTGRAGSCPTVQDLTGQRATFTPKWQGNLGMQYDDALPLGRGDLSYTLRGDLAFVSAANLNGLNDQNPGAVQGGRGTVSARVTLWGPDDRWSLAVYGENLSDRGYCVAIFPTTFDGVLGQRDAVSGRTSMRCIVAPPRTVGVGLRVNL